MPQQKQSPTPTFFDTPADWRWLNNDWVNFIASAFGALVAMGVWGVMRGF